MSDQSQQRFERLEVLKAQAAAALQLPLDHNKVTLVAGLRLEYERQLAVLVGGGKVDASGLANLSETIERLSPTPPPTPRVELTIVPPTEIRCPECGHCFHPRDGKPVHEAQPPERRTLDLPAEAVTPDGEPVPAPARKPAALPAPSRSESGFHDQPGTPLAKEQPRLNGRYFDPNGGGPLCW